MSPHFTSVTRRQASSVGAITLALLLTGCATGSATPASSPSRLASSSSSTPAAGSTPPAQSPAPSPSVASSTPAPSAAPTASGSNTISSPASGASVQGPSVHIDGTGTAPEATLLWRVVRAGTDDIVEQGDTIGGSMGEIGPFEVEVSLDPGSYTVEVWTPDESDAGSATGLDLVSTTFTVT